MDPARAQATGAAARRGLVCGAALLLAFAFATRPAFAELDAACSDAATDIFFSLGDSNPDVLNTAGCDAADVFQVCEFRGSGGPCRFNPACPENQIERFGCTAANEDESCCIEQLRKPCEGCEPVITSCLSLCNGPAPPPDSPQEAQDEFCADIADLRLPNFAQSAPELFTADGCDSAETGQTCDLTGSIGPCTAVPACANVSIFDEGCTPAAEASSCCTVFFAPPCTGCEPEVEFCQQQCDSVGPASAEPAEAPGPSLFLTKACAASATMLLEDLALNSSRFTVGCDGADPLVTCDIQGTAGACEDNPVCPEDQIDAGQCTASTGPPLCCDVAFTKACDDCEPIPLSCVNFCPSDIPAAPLSAEESQDRLCADVADLIVSRLRNNDPDALPEDCASGEPRAVCDLRGTGGACSSAPECEGIEIEPLATCAEEGAEESCCLVGVAPPCAGCEPVPVTCAQGCTSGDNEA